MWSRTSSPHTGLHWHRQLLFYLPSRPKQELSLNAVLNPLRTKLYPFDMKTQSVPRSKHSMSRL